MLIYYRVNSAFSFLFALSQRRSPNLRIDSKRI